MNPVAWIEAYGRAWEERDPDAAAALFTEDALYKVTPFRSAHAGREAIREYWRSATSSQDRVRVRFGEPVAAGERVSVEWWTTLVTDGGDDLTLTGCLLLRFGDDGLCTELREYWFAEPGTHDPPPGWGL